MTSYQPESLYDVCVVVNYPRVNLYIPLFILIIVYYHMQSGGAVVLWLAHQYDFT